MSTAAHCASAPHAPHVPRDDGRDIPIRCRMHYMLPLAHGTDASTPCKHCMVLTAYAWRCVIKWGFNVGVAKHRYVHLTATACYDGSSLARSVRPGGPPPRRGFLIPSGRQLHHTGHLVVAVYNLDFNRACGMADAFRLSGIASCFPRRLVGGVGRALQHGPRLAAHTAGRRRADFRHAPSLSGGANPSRWRHSRSPQAIASRLRFPLTRPIKEDWCAERRRRYRPL